MQYYNIRPTRTNPRSPHENGDCESLNGHIKDAVDQALMLRGSRDFLDREAYQKFIEGLLDKKNAGRTKRFTEECEHLGPLSENRLPSFDTIKIKVRKSSTISVKRSRAATGGLLHGSSLRSSQSALISKPNVAQRLEAYRECGTHPGAFENYQWHDDLFPTVRFRIAYDELLERRPAKASREY
jgi:hypothetical protein